MKTRLALLLPLVALAACTADNNASVKVAGICLPPTDATNCVFSATCSGQYIGRNEIDIGVTNHLWLIVQVNNQLPDNKNLSNFRTNTNDAYVHEVVVEYPGTGLPTATSSILGSAVVPANGTTVISVLAVPESIGDTLRTSGAIPAGGSLDGVAKMRLKGVLGDTTKFETGDFEIPIRVCNGCVGAFACTDPTKPLLAVCPPNQGQLPASAVCFTTDFAGK